MMKLSLSLVLSNLVVSASAFAPAFIVTPKNSLSTQVFSAVLEETSVDDDVMEMKMPKKPQGPTRFDRLKKIWKGPRAKITDTKIEFSYEDFSKAVQETQYAFERNAVVEGVALEYTPTGCLVDIGAKSSAFLPEEEAGLIMDGVQMEDAIPLQSPMEFQIISEEDENGQMLVSVRRIQYKKAWEKVEKMSVNDEAFEAVVVAVNRGGAICLVEGLRAFLPGSHLTGQLPSEDLIGQTLPLKFLEVSQENNKLVVSNRKAVVEQQMTDLSRGDVVTGVVKALKPYGAFVEVGGMSGLLHISQISYDRIDNLEKVLQPGMVVKCMIIDHDKTNGRIALSTKTLEAEPGLMIKNPELVFENAEANAAAYHKKQEEEQRMREQSARDIVLGLGDALDDLGGGSSSEKDSSNEAKRDPLQDVSDSLDSLLS